MASLLFNQTRVEVGPDGASLGRRSDNDLVLESDHASRHHARVEQADDGFRVIDLGSANGTYLNGERIQDEARPLRHGDSIVVGADTVRFFLDQARTPSLGSKPGAAQKSVRFPGGRLTLGRDPSNDMVLGDPSVSRFHAEVRQGDGAVELR